MERTDKLNQHNSDYHRVLFNVLLVITGFECF